MKSWKRAVAVLSTVVVMGIGTNVFAQGADQPQFTIAPPPLAYPDYTAPGSTQGRTTATYINVSTDGFDMTGIGGAFTARAVGERLPDDLGQAFSFGGGLYLLSGEGGGLTLSGFQLAVLGNYERELAPKFIGFGGLNFAGQYLNLTSDAIEVDVFAILFGFQAGVQYSVESGDLTLSPWFMYQQSSGSASVDVYFAGGGYSGTTQDISITSTVIGFDVLHGPSGVTLSGMLQQASGDSSSDVTIIQVSWYFGGDADATPKPTAARGAAGIGIPRS